MIYLDLNNADFEEKKKDITEIFMNFIIEKCKKQINGKNLSDEKKNKEIRTVETVTRKQLEMLDDDDTKRRRIWTEEGGDDHVPQPQLASAGE
uniref:Uncharacterized protein n=1 Tax=Ditylenchus dipsaci TaxID=166011 RepID=A0A915CU08_9BILA